MFFNSFRKRPVGPTIEATIKVVKDDGKEISKKKLFLGTHVCRVDIRDWIHSCMMDMNNKAGMSNTELTLNLIQRNM